MVDFSSEDERLEAYLSGDPKAYPLDDVIKNVSKLKEAVNLGDYRISYVATRDLDNPEIDRLDLDSGARPVCVFFGVKEYNVSSKDCGSVDIVKILPLGWRIRMPFLASYSYMPPEIHEEIETLNSMILDEKPADGFQGKVTGEILTAPIERDLLEEVPASGPNPEDHLKVLLWNILFARILFEKGYPADEQTVEKVREAVLERRTRVLEALKAKNSQKIIEIATKSFS